MSPPRRNILVFLAAGLAAALVVLFGVHRLVLAPAAGLDAEANQLETKIRDTTRELAKEANSARRLTDLYRRTFGTDEATVSEAMRARLMGLLAPSGLTSEQFTSSPVNAQRISRRNNDREVSRNITLKGGKLAHVINLLYLLAEEPYVHRIDSLTLKPSAAERGRVDLQFRFSTLAMEPAKGLSPATGPATTQLATRLDTYDRELYTIIEERDIFRPYVKRPPPEPPPVQRIETPTPAPPPPPPPPNEPEEARWRLAGVPTVVGTEMVFVRHRGGEIRSYKVGQTLPVSDGKIVMIDCRPLPRHDNPRVFSDSRVILQMKDTFWAVELGDRLIDKHRLSAAELPIQLRAPASGPAVGLSRAEGAKP